MKAKILGTIKIDPIVWSIIVTMIAANLYVYHMAVSSGQEPPFPHATITDNATHYPQDIIFRYIMLFASSFLALSFYMSFRWIEYQAEIVGFRKMYRFQFYLAEFSMGCYCVTIGTIDELGIGNLHTPCAIIFFIIWLITIINLTQYITKLR
jgi:hypothetical protein